VIDLDSPPLSGALAVADACLAPPGPAALAADGDPLRLSLPPLDGGAAGAVPTPEALRALAALYLQAELEQAGVIPVAEMLAAARAEFPPVGDTAVAKLEAFAEHARGLYDQHGRARVFARLFGLGPASTNADGAPVNRDFQLRFALLCAALLRYGEDYRLGRPPGPAREADLLRAAEDVLINLGPRQYGNTLPAGPRIQRQLKEAIDLLTDPDVERVFGSRGLWDTVRAVLGADAPDLGRFFDRGQNGLRLLRWLAEVLPRLGAGPGDGPLLAAGAPAFTWAAVWLRASGIEV
jgi:hypothetical protein